MKILIFMIVIVVVFGLLAMLPAIEIDQDAVTSSAAWSWIIAAMYFFPVGTVGAILTLIVALWLFRMIVSLVKTLWELLPIA